MSTFGFHQRCVGLLVICAGLALAAAVSGRPASATEPQGDLGVTLRLVEMIPPNGPAGPSKIGVAKIDVFVEAFRATRDIQLRILRPDGSAWNVKGRPIETVRPAWTDPTGEPLEPSTEGQAVQARGTIRTTIIVPLEGASIHEIVVGVTGLVDGNPIETSAVVRAAWGAPDNQPVDDGIHANFSVKGVE
jgi:hypothetical protein